MRSHLWTSAFISLALISASAAARAGETHALPARLALAPAAAPLSASAPAVKTGEDIRDLLSDPAIRFAVGLAENAWDFSTLDGVPGFGPILVADKRATTTLACAERDRNLITSIEDHGHASDVAPDRLAEAALSMLQARGACRDGHERDALALYDRTLQGLAQTHASR